MTKRKDYEVGFAKPPVEYRFQKGRSGNPGGRPKGARGISAVIAAALSERVTINENGRRRNVTKLEAACKQMANKAAGGDRQAAKLIIELLHQSQARDDARTSTSTTTAEERRAADQVILEAIRERVLGIAPDGVVDE